MNSEPSEAATEKPVLQTLNRVPERILLVDASGAIEIANVAALSLLDVEEEDVCGSDFIAWFSEPDRRNVEKAMLRVLSDEPGNRLEEITAEFAKGAAGLSHLSLARMRHRDAICVVISPSIETKEVPKRGASMPVVDDSELGGVMTKVSSVEPEINAAVKPYPHFSETDSSLKEPMTAVSTEPNAEQQKPDLRPLKSHLPWNARRNPATGKVRPKIVSEDDFTRQVPFRQNTDTDRQTDKNNAIIARSEPIASAREPSDGLAPKPAREEVSKPKPTQQDASVTVPRDIYAEFETERDRRQHLAQDQPLVSPEQCLRTALKEHRDEAVAESVKVTTEMEMEGQEFPLDEPLLTSLFSQLVERLIAVSPPYCDAQITLRNAGKNGFNAVFADIGRGLNESELDSVFNQPELTMGTSHTCLVNAHDAAAKLGMKFSIQTDIENGTTVEVSMTG